MDTDRLRYFTVIYESGSLTKAAELLNISHSALSKAMGALQSELGVSLFRPVGRGLEATEEAHKVYEAAKQILAQVRALKQTHSQLRTIKPINIGMPELLNKALAGLISLALQPESFSLFELGAGELEQMILNRSLDFGYSLAPQPTRGLDHIRIARWNFAAYTSTQYKNTKNCGFVAPLVEPKSNLANIRSLDAWPVEVQRNITHSASSLSSALEITQHLPVALYLPDFLVQQLNLKLKKEFQLVELEAFTKAKQRFDLFLIKRSLDDETSAIKKINRQLRLDRL